MQKELKTLKKNYIFGWDRESKRAWRKDVRVKGKGKRELTNNILFPRAEPEDDESMVAQWSDGMQHSLVGITVEF